MPERSVAGLRLLLIQALQTADTHKIATPENCKPDQDVIVPTPQTTDAAEVRLAESYDTTDWYFSTKAL